MLHYNVDGGTDGQTDFWRIIVSSEDLFYISVLIVFWAACQRTELFRYGCPKFGSRLEGITTETALTQH